MLLGQHCSMLSTMLSTSLDLGLYSVISLPSIILGILGWLEIGQQHLQVDSFPLPCHAPFLIFELGMHPDQLRLHSDHLRHWRPRLGWLSTILFRHCYTWLRADSGITILFNIVDNQEQCCHNNIVAPNFQQPVTTHNFLPCAGFVSGQLQWKTIDYRNWFSKQRIMTGAPEDR